MTIAYKAKKKGAQNERLDNRWWYMLIVGNHQLFPDAAYYANWLSVVCDLKDRMLEKLLVFSLKIEDLTFLTFVCLQAEGKR